jgi:uncharacterized protein
VGFSMCSRSGSARCRRFFRCMSWSFRALLRCSWSAPSRGDSGVLRQASANRRLLFGVATFGILLGGGLSLAAAGQELFDWPSLGRARFPVERLGAVVLALGYAAAVIAAVNLSGGRRMLGWAAPLGRMAFTNYLAQSVICGWIFYGYGLGQFGHLGVAATLAMGIFVYVAQVAFSAWWLRRYRFGPVEWLWRSCMYGIPQPMRQRSI